MWESRSVENFAMNPNLFSVEPSSHSIDRLVRRKYYFMPISNSSRKGDMCMCGECYHGVKYGPHDYNVNNNIEPDYFLN